MSTAAARRAIAAADRTPVRPQTRAQGAANQARHRLRELRQLAGLSLEQLAQLVSSSRPRLHALETGDTRLTQEWMERLAPHLNCAPADLLPAHDHAIVLTEGERALIEAVRALPPERQALVPGIVTSLAAPAAA